MPGLTVILGVFCPYSLLTGPRPERRILRRHHRHGAHMMIRALSVLAITPMLLAAQQPQPTCATPGHRSFDFWVGEWEVADSTGQVIAESSITLRAGGCAVMEHWRPKLGPDGVSINWIEPTDGKWHQQWVGGEGWIAAFVGDSEDGKMVLVATSPTRTPQGEVLTRMTYELLPDARVRQRVLNSRDAGQTWVVSFQGDYKRKA